MGGDGIGSGSPKSNGGQPAHQLGRKSRDCSKAGFQGGIVRWSGAVKIAGDYLEPRSRGHNLVARSEYQHNPDIEAVQRGEVDHELGLLGRGEDGSIHSHNEAPSLELGDVV